MKKDWPVPDFPRSPQTWWGSLLYRCSIGCMSLLFMWLLSRRSNPFVTFKFVCGWMVGTVIIAVAMVYYEFFWKKNTQ